MSKHYMLINQPVLMIQPATIWLHERFSFRITTLLQNFRVKATTFSTNWLWDRFWCQGMVITCPSTRSTMSSQMRIDVVIAALTNKSGLNRTDKLTGRIFIKNRNIINKNNDAIIKARSSAGISGLAGPFQLGDNRRC